MEIEAKDREYWIDRASQEGSEMVDECLKLLNEVDRDLTLNYNQSYIGISQKRKTNNFVIFLPKQSFARAEILVRNVDEWIDKLKNSNFKIVSVGKRNGRLKFRIERKNILSDSLILKEIFKESYESWMA